MNSFIIIIIIIMKAKIIVTLYIKNVTGALYAVNYNENTLSVSRHEDSAQLPQQRSDSEHFLKECDSVLLCQNSPVQLKQPLNITWG